jgi:hypothetical protein
MGEGSFKKKILKNNTILRINFKYNFFIQLKFKIKHCLKKFRQ